MNRRALLASVPAGLLLHACAGPGTPQGGTPLSVIELTTQVETLLLGSNGAPGLLRDISVISPVTLPPAQLVTLEGELKTAGGLIATLTPSTPQVSAAGTLQTIETSFSDAMQGLEAVSPAIPALAPYVTLVDVATQGVLLIEQFINATLGARPGAPVARAVNGRIATMRANATNRGMTPARAVAILKARGTP